jgi:hypothetical protein
MRTRKMRIATFATGVCLTLLGTMALAQSVTYDYDRAANFSTYKTYAWTRGTELADEPNHARVVRAIDGALVAKGLARVEPTPSPVPEASDRPRRDGWDTGDLADPLTPKEQSIGTASRAELHCPTSLAFPQGQGDRNVSSTSRTSRVTSA